MQDEWDDWYIDGIDIVKPPDPEPEYPDVDMLNTRVVNLSKEKYSQPSEAIGRFNELREENPEWQWLGSMFWTARFWCWRIYERVCSDQV